MFDSGSFYFLISNHEYCFQKFYFAFESKIKFPFKIIKRYTWYINSCVKEIEITSRIFNTNKKCLLIKLTQILSVAFFSIAIINMNDAGYHESGLARMRAWRKLIRDFPSFFSNHIPFLWKMTPSISSSCPGV